VEVSRTQFLQAALLVNGVRVVELFVAEELSKPHSQNNYASHDYYQQPQHSQEI
jgi:hypothetical protein